MLVKDLLPKNILDRTISVYAIGVITIYEKQNYGKFDFFETTDKEDLYNYIADTYKNYRVCSIKPISIPVVGNIYYQYSQVESYIEIVISEE